MTIDMPDQQEYYIIDDHDALTLRSFIRALGSYAAFGLTAYIIWTAVQDGYGLGFGTTDSQ
jgi:hypothetical protein